MDWWYDYTIEIVTTSDSYDDDTGLYTEGEETTISIPCDVQPKGNELVYDDTGKLIEYTYQVYCDPNAAITKNISVRYNNQFFTVEKITPWDDYCILYIRAVG